MKLITGWTISIIFGVLGIAIPGSGKAEVSTVTPPPAVLSGTADRLTESQRKLVLMDFYQFGERGERIKTLQVAIGSVRVDGVYGKITRREHVEKLNNLNLSTSNVPALPMSDIYNISNNPSERCPQWTPLFKEVGLEPVEVFSYLAWRESGCNPSAQNAKWDANGNMTYHLNKDKSYDTGLLQINSSWYSVTKLVCGDDAVNGRMQGLKDPICNVRVAKYIMDNSKGKLANWRIYKN